jgi:hypothetical protein
VAMSIFEKTKPICRPLAVNPTTPVPFPDACCPVLSRNT